MKHAYLIITNKIDYVFNALIKTIDNPNNDIFIMLDLKSKSKVIPEIDTKYSKIYFVPRIKVVWGGYSLIEAELVLFKSAIKNNYDFYHLLSGQDLCIKSQKYIQDFFSQHPNQIFLSFDRTEGFNKTLPYRYRYYSIERGRDKTLWGYSKMGFNKLFRGMQKMLFIHRKPTIKIVGGSQWCSLPHEFVAYLLSQEEVIKHNFKYGFLVDELFIQSICKNSEYINRVYHPDDTDNNPLYESCRLIDWSRKGELLPHTFNEEDYDQLINTKALFARKFTYNDNNKIVDKILDYLNIK